MAELSDHAISFTITLTPPAITCAGATPHYASGGALLVDCDLDNDGILCMDDVFAAMNRTDLTSEEKAFVNEAYMAGSINALCPGAYTAPSPAEGQLINISYPSNAIQGTPVSIECRVRNLGESAGNFKVGVYYGSSLKTQTSPFTLSGSVDGKVSSSSIKMLTVTVPTTGVNVTYTLRCIRIT